MRLLRLVVACLFFVVARPALAAESLFAADEIVLVAEGEHAEQEARAIAPAATPPSAPIARVRVLRALQSDRVLRERTYLRHCSLLC